jgi:2-phosphosulfolactate phosphatase
MTFDQSVFDIRCEWGENGVRQLAPISDAIIIVDVLSFSTCVTLATSRGALIFPYPLHDGTGFAFARSINAALAGPRGQSTYSLSPQSLLEIAAGTRLVLPSPNGAILTLATGGTPTFAGCLRNCRAVAAAALRYGKNIAVIPAGERWPEDGSLRVAVEDLVGAGAIISHLSGSLSPEAQMAVVAYYHARENLVEVFDQCGSGKELRERGFEGDIALAAQVDVDDCAPMLQNGAYIKAEQGTAPDRDSAALQPRRGVLALGNVTSRGRHRR